MQAVPGGAVSLRQGGGARGRGELCDQPSGRRCGRRDRVLPGPRQLRLLRPWPRAHASRARVPAPSLVCSLVREAAAVVRSTVPSGPRRMQTRRWRAEERGSGQGPGPGGRKACAGAGGGPRDGVGPGTSWERPAVGWVRAGGRRLTFLRRLFQSQVLRFSEIISVIRSRGAIYSGKATARGRS